MFTQNDIAIAFTFVLALITIRLLAKSVVRIFTSTLEIAIYGGGAYIAYLISTDQYDPRNFGNDVSSIYSKCTTIFNLLSR